MLSKLDQNGYEILEGIYSIEEVDEILSIINAKGLENKFGIREFLFRNPDVTDKVFTKRLKGIIKDIAPSCVKSIKSIYFDKPPSANWIVNWHQDLTVNVKDKKEVDTYKNWRTNEERTIVQPNIEMLQSIFTIRIHLDDCTKENGALRIIENSHSKGVIDIKEWMENKSGIERICEVKKGGVLIMKPLALHSSRRVENNNNRRVIHIEFTDNELPSGLDWKENVAVCFTN